MFGYVRPYRGELKVRELEAYQSLYCGLCHTMGRRYGFLARFLLNYDFTFLAMLLTPGENLPATERRRCVACPLRGKEVCPSNSGLEIAADELYAIITARRLERKNRLDFLDALTESLKK